jgi:hypothetical protein
MIFAGLSEEPFATLHWLRRRIRFARINGRIGL